MEGAVSWSGMLILSTVIADIWKKSRVSEVGVAGPSAAALAAGLLLAAVAPISKNRVSASYVLVSLGASGLLFAVVLLLVNRLRLRAAYLRWWGINPLLLYIMHYLLLALVVLPGRAVVARAGIHSPCRCAGRGDPRDTERGRLVSFPPHAAGLPARVGPDLVRIGSLRPGA